MIIKTGFEMRKKRRERERGMMTELTDGRFFFFLKNTKLESKPIFFLSQEEEEEEE